MVWMGPVVLCCVIKKHTIIHCAIRDNKNSVAFSIDRLNRLPIMAYTDDSLLPHQQHDTNI